VDFVYRNNGTAVCARGLGVLISARCPVCFESVGTQSAQRILEGCKMKRKDIERYRQELIEVLKIIESERGSSLRKLANEVGASLVMAYEVGYAGEGEIVHNIEQALRTETMIDMCKIANRNFVIALIATIIALGSAVALWVAVCK